MEINIKSFKNEMSTQDLQNTISFAGADGSNRNNHKIESDHDTLEPFAPFEQSGEQLEINTENPNDLCYWANQFQISVDDLKAAIVLNGNSIGAIKKYLSV